MVTADPIIPGAAALAEAKAYLRIPSSDEDPLIERLLRNGAELCEQFTGQALLVRGFTETVQASAGWTRLRRLPVTQISAVATAYSDGSAVELSTDSYAIDIDASGAGWVRLTGARSDRPLRVQYRAGLAATWVGIPEPLRQGVIRLVGHLYSHRSDGVAAGPPAAVTALWRPYRRMRLS